MDDKLTRRHFLAGSMTAAALPALGALANAEPKNGTGKAVGAPAVTKTAPGATDSFAFPLLGDLHFDRLSHHDIPWMEKEYPDDIRQVQNYSRISTEVAPQLFTSIGATVADLNKQAATRVPFVLHIGDFVEGVCGSYELSKQQNQEAIAFTRGMQLGAPWLFCKGNHDVTGPGSKEVFNDVILPFLTEELRKAQPAVKNQADLARAFYTARYGDSLFAFFDAYDHPGSLDWLEATLAANPARHVFVLIHPPVVPYGARATWHIYSRPREAAERTRLLNILGKYNAIVLTGHLHKYNLMTRKTDTGRFLQLSVNSVIPRPDVKTSDELDGIEHYTPDQIKVEPRFSPKTEDERRAILAAEAPLVDYFEYADAPGYAVMRVQGDTVSMDYYTGANRQLWKTRDLTAILKGQRA